jgi:hypothetical protein
VFFAIFVGVVQQAHTLQAIWGFGLMEKLVCIWKIWQIRIMGLI